MSLCYGPLARWYDRLTEDVPYGRFADLYQAEFSRRGGKFHLLLDLCCGTGTLTVELTRRGYELIGVDASEDMLMRAMDKASGLSPSPLFLCQDAAALDLYGTVDAAYCSLDGINYIPPNKLSQTFHRLGLFIRPGGLFIFDIRPPEWLRGMDGAVSVDETEEMLCLWRADFDARANCLVYGMDIFSKRGSLWRRESEEHIEYAYSVSRLTGLLERSGFGGVRLISDPPAMEDRVFISAERR